MRDELRSNLYIFDEILNSLSYDCEMIWNRFYESLTRLSILGTILIDLQRFALRSRSSDLALYILHDRVVESTIDGFNVQCDFDLCVLLNHL